MRIIYDLPHVFNPLADPKENAYVLSALLDCLVSINEAYLRDHTVLDLYHSGVVYGRTEHWDCIPALYAKGYGDCKSLSAALIAQYRKKGIEAEPVFRWIRNSGGGTDFHILVQTIKGFEDPSKVLGMGRNENARSR